MSVAEPLTSFMVSNKLGLLEQLHGMLDNQTVRNRSQFTDTMQAAFTHGELSYRKLADDMGYSASSVHRWIDGRSAPHPSLWSGIVDWVKSEIEARLEAAEA